MPRSPHPHDAYRLIGGAGDDAVAHGLANAAWYQCPVPRPLMKDLMKRRDGRAILDTMLWFTAIGVAGALAVWAWTLQSWWALPAFLLYAGLYAGPADSRWHECGHGTAFKTRWMNDTLYQVAAFMLLRQPTVWRWSHARHHTDTLVTGRDPEIAVPRPPSLLYLGLALFNLRGGLRELRAVLRHARGTVGAAEATFVPATEHRKVVREARAWLALYAAIAVACVATRSILPALLVGPVPALAGAWLYLFFGLPQHAGLPENVLDHRLNCRTVYMNPVFRFLYWNMNYHVEHHMFPMVPYHALPRLHDAIRADCPTPYPNMLSAYREIVAAVLRQRRDPTYCVRRELPPQAGPARFAPVATAAPATPVPSQPGDSDAPMDSGLLVR
ncbi:fatty acid desaturase family protein [Ralstonia solanacearum]